MDGINACQPQDRRHHRRDRRHRVPDQHPGAQRRGRSRARRRAGPRLRGGRRRGAQPGAAQRQRGQGDQGADRRLRSTRSKTGSQLVDSAGKTMDEIVQSVKRVTDIMAEIAAAREEQSGGIEQVNNAVVADGQGDAAERGAGRRSRGRRQVDGGADGRTVQHRRRVPDRFGCRNAADRGSAHPDNTDHRSRRYGQDRVASGEVRREKGAGANRSRWLPAVAKRIGKSSDPACGR